MDEYEKSLRKLTGMESNQGARRHKLLPVSIRNKIPKLSTIKKSKLVFYQDFNY